MDTTELSSLLDKVKQLAATGDAKSTIDALRTAELMIWNALPLYINKAVLVTAKAEAYGIYDPRDSNVFASGEKIFVYIEPGAFDFKVENGIYGLSLNADFALLTPDGTVLTGQRDFLKGEFRSRTPITNFMLNVDLNLSGLAAGDYVIELVVKDMVQGSNHATLRLPVTFR